MNRMRNAISKTGSRNCTKGFIISIDAVIALLLSIFFISYIFSIINTLATYESFSYVKLGRTGEDTLKMMEQLNIFGSQSAMNNILQQTGDQICIMIEIYNQSFVPAQKKNTFLKPGCNYKQATAGEEKVFRTYYQDGKFYYALATVWLKEKS